MLVKLFERAVKDSLVLLHELPAVAFVVPTTGSAAEQFEHKLT